MRWILCRQEPINSGEEADITVEERKRPWRCERGGRGNAGLNKHRLMTCLKYICRSLGMHGFNRHPSLRTAHNSVVNVSVVEDMLGDDDTIDLGEIVDKLLGLVVAVRYTLQ